MLNQFSRTEMLIGGENLKKLSSCRVAVFGIGGVGGHTVDALARSGIGAIDLIDNDTFSITNINRQIFATLKTVGKLKTEVAASHILDINPDIKVKTHNVFFTPETSNLFDFSEYDYIVDAIDSVTGKIELVLCAKKAGVPIISCLGTGNKLNPTEFCVADIFETSVCPLARVMRSELKKRNIEKLKVVYSKEEPKKPLFTPQENDAKRQIPASCAFVPSVAGLIIASEVIKDLAK